MCNAAVDNLRAIADLRLPEGNNACLEHDIAPEVRRFHRGSGRYSEFEIVLLPQFHVI